jgi:hypothetical protein
VPALHGTSFGFRYRVLGPVQGEIVTALQATLLPPEGVRSPGAKAPFTSDTSEIHLQVGGENRWMFTFDYPWEMVPGIWTIQIWSGSKRVGEEAFEVFIPPSV